MSKYTYLLDAGHGGVIGGIYQTSGKRSPIFENGTQLFEGVFNRQVVEKIKELLKVESISFIDIVNSDKDVPLGKRVQIANEFYSRNPKCVYISVHANAAGDGSKFHPASGIEVFTSKGQTKSDIFASMLIDKLDDIITGVKWRTDSTDGDTDKEENYYVLKETRMPAVLSENGFMTNEAECKRMLTEDFQSQIALAHVNAIKEWEKLY